MTARPRCETCSYFLPPLHAGRSRGWCRKLYARAGRCSIATYSSGSCSEHSSLVPLGATPLAPALPVEEVPPPPEMPPCRLVREPGGGIAVVLLVFLWICLPLALLAYHVRLLLTR